MLAVTYALFQTKPVQTWVSQKIAAFLSRELKSTITIKGVDFHFFNTLVLEELFISDQHKDTLLLTKELYVSIGAVNFKEGRFLLSSVILDNALVKIRNYRGEVSNNLKFILDYFSKDRPKSTKAILFELEKLEIINSGFVYLNEHKDHKTTEINYYDLDIRNINTSIERLRIDGDSIRGDITELNFNEKSGFVLNHMEGKIRIIPGSLQLFDFVIETPESRIGHYFSMRFDKWTDFKDFNTKVFMVARFEDSRVTSDDISFFAPGLSSYDQKLLLDGHISGTVNNLQARDLKLIANHQSIIRGNFSIQGLPDLKQTYYKLHFARAVINRRDVEDIMSHIPSARNVRIPPMIRRLGNIEFTGSFTGTSSDFLTRGTLNTDLGQIVSDLYMKFGKGQLPVYSGNVKVNNFNLGRLLERSSTIGRVSMNASFRGSGFSAGNLSNQLTAKVQSIELNRYAYHDISIQGNIGQKLFTGSVNVNDRYAKMDFDGTVNFNNPGSPEFDFIAFIKDAHLHKLNLTPDSTVLSTAVRMNFYGDKLDNIQGTIQLSKTYLTNKQGNYFIDSIDLSARNDSAGKSLQLVSDIADVDIRGEYEFSSVIYSFRSMLETYAPSFDWGPIRKTGLQDFTFKVTVKNTAIITGLVTPGLSIPDTAIFNGHFDSRANKLRFTGGLDKMLYKDLVFYNLIIDGENDSAAFNINIAVERLLLKDSIYINNITIANRIANDSLKFNIKLSDKTAANQLDLNGQVAFRSDRIRLGILPSELIVNYQVWKIQEAFQITYAEKKIHISSFALTNESQEVLIDGIISKNPSEALRVRLKNLDLTAINQLSKKYHADIDGTINGEASFGGVLGDPRISSTLFIRDFIYNKDTIGNVALSADWDHTEKLISISGNVINDRYKTIDMYGKIYTNRKEDNLAVNLTLNEADLKIFEPFVSKIVSDLSGTATADLVVSGSLTRPKLNGKLNLSNAGLRINYLQTYITFSDEIDIINNNITISDLQLTDIDGNKAVLNGNLQLNTDWKFFVDAHIAADNFLCLNTTSKDNELYYGHAKMSGDFYFYGPLNDLKINIEAKTNRNTEFFIPLSDQNSVTQQKFINFVQKDTGNMQQHYDVDLSGIVLNFDLEVTEDAEVQLIFDETAGDIVKGRGNANLQLIINTLGDFEMFGEYVIAEGEYLFTFQDVIKKRFKVEPGGTIRWSGSPSDATIALRAVYSIRASINNLMQEDPITATDSATKITRRIPVECVLIMENNLLAPNLRFELNFPEDEDIEASLAGYLNDPDNVNIEVFSLLVFQRFSGQRVGGQSNLISASGFEWISNELNNSLSKFYKDLDVSINSERGLAGSLRLFDDRLTIDGNVVTYDNGDQLSDTTQKASDLTGDVTVEYKLSADGRLRVKAFNRTANSDPLSRHANNQSVQGLGVFYREEFDTFGELFDKIFKKEQPQ